MLNGARRARHRRRHLPDAGAARRDRRPHPAQAGGGQHRAGRAGGTERVPRPRRRRRRHPRRDRVARSRLVQDDRRRRLAQRHGALARRADAPLLHRSREPDHQGRLELGDGRRDLLGSRDDARRAHPGLGLHAEGRRRAQRRLPAPCRRADVARPPHRRLRHPAADVDLRAHRRRRQVAVSRVRGHPGPHVRELQPAELPRDSPARDHLGGRPVEPRRARQEGRARRRAALSGWRPCASVEGGGDDRGASGLQPVAGSGRAADRQADEHRLGRARPPLGLGNAGVSQRPAPAEHPALEGFRVARACEGNPRAGGHDLDPHGYQ